MIMMHCVLCYYTIHYLLVVVCCLVGERMDCVAVCFVLCCRNRLRATPPAEAGPLVRAKIAAPLNNFLAGERER